MTNRDIRIVIGKVIWIEDTYSQDGYDGLRIKAKIYGDKTDDPNTLPWAFPLLPKTFQSIPKIGEAVFILKEEGKLAQRYYIGPIISQPQYNTFCAEKNATTLLNEHTAKPIEKISNVDDTRGSFPSKDSVAIVGRGAEDISLNFNQTTRASEINLRAGIRGEPTNSNNENMIGNIIFNGTDPAYIQLKYKSGLSSGKNKEGNSLINMVANRINIMSNKDEEISHNLQDKDNLIADDKIKDVMDKLHQVPKGDELVKLLTIIKECILHHVHPWAGMEQCGDWGGYIKELEKFDMESILSKYVRIS